MLNSVLGALQVALACQNLKKTFKVDEKSLAYKNPKTKKVKTERRRFVKQCKKAVSTSSLTGRLLSPAVHFQSKDRLNSAESPKN